MHLIIDELASLGDTTVGMTSTVVPENPVERTYKIIRRRADGLAHAISIAEKYRLQRRIAQPENAETESRIKDVGLDPVEFVVLQTLGRVSAARAGIGIGGLGQELGQFLGALPGAAPDADRVRRMSLVQEIGAAQPRRTDHQPRRALAELLVPAPRADLGALSHIAQADIRRIQYRAPAER